MDREVDILHPLASLEWRQCRGPPVNIRSIAQAVWLKDKVYVGGGTTSGSKRDDARLYIYSPATDTWTTLDTPVYRFALTTYHSQLVLVSGVEYVGESVKGEPTNKLWTLSEDDQWQETLPPMPLHHGDLVRNTSAVSHGDHLLVISDDKVYVYNGHHWASAQPPPQRLGFIKSTIVNGHWYLMGTEGLTFVPQKTCVYSVSLDSLLASCQPSETSQPSSLWERLTDIPSESCCPVVFGNRLVAVGERLAIFPAPLYAYSSFTQSWVHIGDVPLSLISGFHCPVVLPSHELMIVRGRTAFKAILKMTPFNPESSFSMRAVSLLEAAAGIPVKSTLNNYTRHIRIFLALHQYTNLDLNGLLNYWINNVQWVRPTWKNLLLIIRLLNLDELAQRMETYLSGATEEPQESPEGEVEEVTQEEEKQTIYHLKQEMASLKEEKDALEEKIKEQVSEIEQLRSRLSLVQIKTEGEEKPVLPLLLKSELKEEAATMTKAETMSAQPTTATWNLRGVEVCGEMTVVVYSSHYQQITWPGYGLRLHIPKGCLPAGMEQCTINIKASLAGQYEFPENSHLVSAVFWLRCEDVHKFTTPITVEIQHCAKSENVTNPLSFVRAVCSQKQLPYTFKQLPGSNFTSHSSYGVIELNSFSGVAIAHKGVVKKRYRSKLFYLDRCNEIHFIVTWNTEAHLTVIEKEYIKKGAHSGPDQNVEFESDMISLDIPMEGLSIKGWKITPLIRPVEEVDDFLPGMGTPRCQLKVEFTGEGEKIPVLKDISLLGAKYPHDVFKIDLSTFCNTGTTFNESQTSGELASSSATGPPPAKRQRSDDQNNTIKPELKDLAKELYSTVSDKWEDIGILLGIKPERLNAIKAAEKLPQSCLREMLKIWLNRVSSPPSWSAIAEAIEHLGDQSLADHLRTTYLVHSPPK